MGVKGFLPIISTNIHPENEKISDRLDEKSAGTGQSYEMRPIFSRISGNRGKPLTSGGKSRIMKTRNSYKKFVRNRRNHHEKEPI